QVDDRPWPLVGVRSQPMTTDTFKLDFSAPPPPEMIRHIPSATDPTVSVAAFAFAEIVAFDDADNDGTFHVGSLATGSRMVGPDAYRGTAPMHAIFYVQQAHPPPLIPELDRVLSASVGYHLAMADCDPSTTDGQFTQATQGEQFRIALGPAQAMLPESRVCLLSHVLPLTP
ncbi:MAG TPA: hypothetical protein VNO55_09285, partial [Polyangia bacterium]|nr:hypothetical protein [Polyangia bacterium]